MSDSRAETRNAGVYKFSPGDNAAGNEKRNRATGGIPFAVYNARAFQSHMPGPARDTPARRMFLFSENANGRARTHALHETFLMGKR